MQKIFIFSLILAIALLGAGCNSSQSSSSGTAEYPKTDPTTQSDFFTHYQQASKMELKSGNQQIEITDSKQISDVLALLQEVKWKPSFYAESTDLAKQKKKVSLAFYKADHMMGMVLVTLDNHILFMDLANSAGSSATYVNSSDASTQIHTILSFLPKP